MPGLPASTEIHKLITKKKVYEQFGAEMSAERRRKFDTDIARMTLTNEISPVSVNLAPGENVQSFFVLHVALKTRDFDAQNIAYLARLFGQRLILVLEADNQWRLAVWQTKLLMTDWAAPDSFTIPLEGTNLDKAWDNIVSRIAGVELQHDKTLDEQLAAAAQREKLQKEIAKLEKQARAEKQPKRKFELVQKAKALAKQFEDL